MSTLFLGGRIIGRFYFLLYTYLNFCLQIVVLLFLNYLFIFREGRGRKRGRPTLMHERNISWPPLARPQPGTRPKTQACALTRNWTGELLAWGMTPNPVNHTSQGSGISFIIRKNVLKKRKCKITMWQILLPKTAAPINISSHTLLLWCDRDTALQGSGASIPAPWTWAGVSDLLLVSRTRSK